MYDLTRTTSSNEALHLLSSYSIAFIPRRHHAPTLGLRTCSSTFLESFLFLERLASFCSFFKTQLKYYFLEKSSLVFYAKFH